MRDENLSEVKKTPSGAKQVWLARLDRFSLVCGALIPVGLVVGNAGFEGVIVLAGLGWLLRSVLAAAWGEPEWRLSLIGLGRHPLIRPWLLWYGVILLSLAWNSGFSGKWDYNLAFVRHLIFLAAMCDISSRQPVWKYFLYGLAGGVVWAALNTFSAHLFGQDFVGHELARYTGKLKEGTRVAHLAAFAAPFYAGRVLMTPDPSKRQERLLVVLSVLAFILVFVTLIRTTMLAAVVGLVLPLLLRRRRFRFLLPLALLLAGLGWLSLQNDSRLWGLTSVYHRFYIWQVSWLMFLDHPFFGVSVSAYQTVFPQYASAALASSFHLPNPAAVEWTEASHAHNLFLMVLACNGIAGLLAFSRLLLQAVRLALQPCQGWRAGLLSWPVVFLVIALVGTNIYDGATLALFTFFLVLIGCGGGISEGRNEKEGS